MPLDLQPISRADADRMRHKIMQSYVKQFSGGGPRTEEGKRISSLNAVKTGLTGRTVLLAGDDAEAYRQHIADYEKEYKPEGLRESELVQSLADTQWRLTRIPGLESALYAKGRHEFADDYPDYNLATRIQLIDLDVHLKYEKQLRNLQLQESRLLRRYNKELTELRALQAERQPAKEKAPVKTKAAASSAPFDDEFVFSTEPATREQIAAVDRARAHAMPLVR